MTRIRPYRAGDAHALHDIFRRAVLEGAAGAYTEAERQAWLGRADMPADWSARLGDEITLVGEAGGAPAGFMTLGRDGHLDLAYVLPEAQGTGLAAALHDRIVRVAQEHAMPGLTTEASIVARRFFLKQGWRVIAEQSVERNGMRLRNYRMEKCLGTEAP